MTQDEIISMALEAGILFQEVTGLGGMNRVITCGSQNIENIEMLIQLVAAREREECAKVCEAEDVAPTDDAVGVQECIARAIRARGQA